MLSDGSAVPPNAAHEDALTVDGLTAHGAYCVGCCWGLMLLLFAVGLMNLVAMVVLTGVIFAEKVVPRGPLIGKVAAGALVLYGVLTIALSVLH